MEAEPAQNSPAATTPATSPVPSQTLPPTTVASATPGNYSTSPVIFLVMGFVLGAALAGVIFWFYLSTKPVTSNISTTPTVHNSSGSQNPGYANPFASSSGSYQNPFDTGQTTNSSYQNPFSGQ